jgi:hypothetical protein
MYLYRRIAADSQLAFRAGLPTRWANDPLLRRFSSHRDLIQELRSSSALADELTVTLLHEGSPEASLLLVHASTPLVLGWTKRDWGYFDDVVVEVAIVVGEFRLEEDLEFRRHPLHCLVDLAADRVRKRRVRSRDLEPIPGHDPAWDRPCQEPGPEELAVGHMAIDDVRRALVTLPPRRMAEAVTNWNTVVELMGRSNAQAERNRLSHSRQRLRLCLEPLLVA